ncbi:hypothetical protein E2C01_071927 [Portunus trituberculatus]|uniref:Uncharacterized protein n=1 Tax=Portunus trituberculatus TaxID=210409 RepID=A0A5B7I566_PORTR|nr:hypothetical protein [Portunus trituberculatus]
MGRPRSLALAESCENVCGSRVPCFTTPRSPNLLIPRPINERNIYDVFMILADNSLTRILRRHAKTPHVG